MTKLEPLKSSRFGKTSALIALLLSLFWKQIEHTFVFDRGPVFYLMPDWDRLKHHFYAVQLLPLLLQLKTVGFFLSTSVIVFHRREAASFLRSISSLFMFALRALNIGLQFFDMIEKASLGQRLRVKKSRKADVRTRQAMKIVILMCNFPQLRLNIRFKGLKTFQLSS